MVCSGLKPEGAGWFAQTNPLSYGGTPYLKYVRCHQHLMSETFNILLTQLI